MKRVVVLASGSGSNLQALIDAVQSGELQATIAGVISDRPGAGALQRAVQAGIPAVTVPLHDRRDAAARAEFEHRLADEIAALRPDLVVLAGWMLILGDPVLGHYRGRVINVHPALLPDGPEAEVESSQGPVPALRGAHAVRDALRRGMPLTGATVHIVTPAVDTGPVLLREEVPILAGDDQERLHNRIKLVEHQLLPRAVALALESQAAEENSWRA
ncbi:MAG: phosphoribosylglycinamide formyltransferase [Thermomicrobiales bacterium]|nr:phosphoribosylglycinamide formyltransferase [Thermomicrobiales bacterium]MCA9876871.1 phosphoribosylglycinamide formyltransferase [Thermomicrobiales bacterium]